MDRLTMETAKPTRPMGIQKQFGSAAGKESGFWRLCHFAGGGLLIFALQAAGQISPALAPSPAGSTQTVFEAMGPTLGKSTTADARPVDKSRFNLFHPTPGENLRDINALYNGPYTVDAGHVQTETVVVLHAWDRYTAGGEDVSSRYLSIGSTTLRLGLLNNLDLGVTVPPHVELRIRDHVARTETIQKGVGDLTLRSKLNLWGNDGGSTAFGLVGFLKLPTNQDHLGNDYVEGGLGLPLAVELPKGWWLGVTPEFHCFHDVNGGGGYHMNFAGTAFLWHSIIGSLSGYVETANWVSAEHDTPWISTVDIGLTYVWGAHVQLDAGAYIGATRAANDITPFLGVSLRF